MVFVPPLVDFVVVTLFYQTAIDHVYFFMKLICETYYTSSSVQDTMVYLVIVLLPYVSYQICLILKVYHIMENFGSENVCFTK